MKEVAERICSLRKSMKLSQMKMAEILGVKQSSLNRYELNMTSPTFETLLRYADYFDVSMDYLYGRTDDPHGMYYACKTPEVEKSYPEMDRFIEMCFEPGSPMNERLKESLFQMMTEGKK